MSTSKPYKLTKRKIKDNKQHTINEGKKVNEKLKIFQDKFTRQLNELSQALDTRLDEEKTFHAQEIRKGHERMQNLEQAVVTEREERQQSLATQLAPIRADQKQIQDSIDAERQARLAKEREILDILHEQSAIVEEAITKEQKERLERQAEVTVRIQKHIDVQNERIAAFKEKQREDFEREQAEVDTEIDSRFKHQDELIKDIQHFISTFQKTLKAVGGKTNS